MHSAGCWRKCTQGRTDEARTMFERLLALRNKLELLSEEYDPNARRMTGTMPQAFSHTALIASTIQYHTIKFSGNSPATRQQARGA